MPLMLRIAGTIPESIVDGPGFRFALFTQGCPHHCPGCHNPQTWPFEGGEDIDIEEIYQKIKSNPLIKGVTFSGGEPFCHSAACAELAEGAHRLGLNVWCYSGYTFEELVQGKTEWLEQSESE